MARNLRPEMSAPQRPRQWLRALLLAMAVTGLGAGSAVPSTAVAQAEAGRSMSVPISPTAPERYVVQKGDTLWDISAMYLNDPWYWPEIWHVNPSIANPHLIYPGDVLFFSYVDGKPRVTLESAGTTRLSPEVRTSDLDGAIRAIPYDLLMDFVGRPGLLTRDDVRHKPYVVGMRNRHIVGSTANEMYARGLENPAAGTRYNIMAVGDELRDPDDGDLLGYIGHYAGLGEVIQSSGAVVPGEKSIFNMRREEPLTHLNVLETGREIMQGDKMFLAQGDTRGRFRAVGTVERSHPRTDHGRGRRRVRVRQVPGGCGQPRQAARARPGQRARHVLPRRDGPRSLRPSVLVGVHGELRPGPAAG